MRFRNPLEPFQKRLVLSHIYRGKHRIHKAGEDEEKKSKWRGEENVILVLVFFYVFHFGFFSFLPRTRFTLKEDAF